jgi:hypothetical protein
MSSTKFLIIIAFALLSAWHLILRPSYGSDLKYFPKLSCVESFFCNASCSRWDIQEVIGSCGLSGVG